MSLLRKLGLAPTPGTVALDEMSLEQVAEVDAGGHGGAIAVGRDAVWITTTRGRRLSRIDPASRTETARAELPKRPEALAVDSLGPIVLCDKGVIVRVDVAGNGVSAEAQMPEGVNDVVAAPGGVWAMRVAGLELPWQMSLVRLDPASLTPVQEVAIGSAMIGGGLRTGDGVVCALIEDPPGSMSQVVLDIATGERLPAGRAPTTRGIAERDGTRWVSDGERGFKRVDVATGEVLATGRAPGPRTRSAVLGHGCLWTCNYREPSRGESPGQS